MKLRTPKSDLYIPDGMKGAAAINRTTHLGIGAHQDDLEFMAMHGIVECYGTENNWFGGITCTDGSSSARSGPYADFTDEQMQMTRVEEQREAAKIGEYAFMAQLGYASSFVKTAEKRLAMVEELLAILKETQPSVVYTHNPFDKHATHIGVFLAVLEAINQLPQENRPQHLFGCEVWRGLDWLPDSMKVIHPVDTHPGLAPVLNGVFKSQIAGGKRYDLAVDGRRSANATFLDAHSVDQCQRASYAIDLTPLIQKDALPLETFISEVLATFSNECTQMIKDLKR